jgi:hypothetical protein
MTSQEPERSTISLPSHIPAACVEQQTYSAVIYVYAKLCKTLQVYTQALGLTALTVILTAVPPSTTSISPVAARNPLPRLLFPAAAQIANFVTWGSVPTVLTTDSHPHCLLQPHESAAAAVSGIGQFGEAPEMGSALLQGLTQYVVILAQRTYL